MARRDFQGFQVLQAKPRVVGNRLGTIVKLQRQPIVDFTGNPLAAQAARVVASVSADSLGMAAAAGLPVLLAFEDEDPARPIIIDVVVDELSRAPALEEVFTVDVPQREAAPPSTAVDISQGAMVGAIVSIEVGAVLVQVDGLKAPVPARTAIVLRNLKDPVLLIRADEDLFVIVGQLYSSVPMELAGDAAADVSLRGGRVRIEADVELILKAGGCEITLDARGKIVSTGDVIVSRARGANKVQGGSVQLN